MRNQRCYEIASSNFAMLWVIGVIKGHEGNASIELKGFLLSKKSYKSHGTFPHFRGTTATYGNPPELELWTSWDFTPEVVGPNNGKQHGKNRGIRPTAKTPEQQQLSYNDTFCEICRSIIWSFHEKSWSNLKWYLTNTSEFWLAWTGECGQTTFTAMECDGESSMMFIEGTTLRVCAMRALWGY